MKRAIILILIVVIVGVFLSVRTNIRGSALAPFNNYLCEYISIPHLRREAVYIEDIEDNSAAYIKGKIITVDQNDGKIDDIYFDLPEEWRATQPEEVGTVMWLEWGKEIVGHYTDGAEAYVNTARVTIIDNSIPAIIDRKIFRGSYPSWVKRRRGTRFGSKPTGEIVNYIKRLPKEAMPRQHLNAPLPKLAQSGAEMKPQQECIKDIMREHERSREKQHAENELKVKVKVKKMEATERQLSITVEIANNHRVPIQLAEFDISNVRFVNPSVLLVDTAYPVTLLVDEGVIVEDEKAIAPSETRTITVIVADDPYWWGAKRLSNLVSNSPFDGWVMFIDTKGKVLWVKITGLSAEAIKKR